MATRSASPTVGPNSILNLDMAAWSKSPRPDPSCTDLGGFGPPIHCPALPEKPSRSVWLGGGSIIPFEAICSKDTAPDNPTLCISCFLSLLELLLFLTPYFDDRCLSSNHGRQVSTQLQVGLPKLESSDWTLSENNNNNTNDGNPHLNWNGDGGGTNDGSSQGMLRPLGGNFGCIGSGDRGPGSGGTRGEGSEWWRD
ncbi:hypothetical protein CRG98_018419 [Punica granatum]|uniref:Uncharacterized protein n=1 Tax=Punica granatum TaxID=22663 RepID=A0A2I0JXX1_PUNGR|nr:hypothetical protein CRG98_018419 [Punica granatum]